MPKTTSAKRRAVIPLQGRIFCYLLGFTALLLVLLWLFQIMYLNEFYTKIKIRQIAASSAAIEHNIENDDIKTLIDRVAQNQEMCIRMYNITAMEQGRSLAEMLPYDVDILADCLIHHMPDMDLARLYRAALNSGGTHTEIRERFLFRNSAYKAELFWGSVPRSDNGLSKSMILSHVFKNAEGDELLLLLNTNITPVDSTVDTLRVQLLYITAILIAAALVLSFIIARHLAAPIKRINATAKNLARGDFSHHFDGRGYRETGELAATLNYAASELSRTERLQQELIANISHDLRTPLTMIGGYAEMMRDLPTENNSENAQVIIDEVGRLSSLVNNVLDLSKLQSGMERIVPADFDLNETAEMIVENYRRLAAPEGYAISYESEGEAWVKADEAKIEQVIYNFLGNAVNYSGPDKTITVRLKKHEGAARLEVSDSGEGIEPDRLQDIWQRYWRAEGAHKRAPHGTGLGLSIVREVLERHNAAYGVESTPGQGSTFWFELPLM